MVVDRVVVELALLLVVVVLDGLVDVVDVAGIPTFQIQSQNHINTAKAHLNCQLTEFAQCTVKTSRT